MRTKLSVLSQYLVLLFPLLIFVFGMTLNQPIYMLGKYAQNTFSMSLGFWLFMLKSASTAISAFIVTSICVKYTKETYIKNFKKLIFVSLIIMILVFLSAYPYTFNILQSAIKMFNLSSYTLTMVITYFINYIAILISKK